MSELPTRMLMLVVTAALATCTSHSRCEKDPSIQTLQKYLRIDTSKAENLGQSANLWHTLALEAGLKFEVYWPAAKPIVVLKWRGKDPDQKSIMFNHHADVASVEDNWTYYPFGAYVDENGDIYARGSQDSKGVGIMQYEAMKRLKATGFRPLRNIYMTIMPDKETGGSQGMKMFVKMQEFQDMNVALAIDEGLPSANDMFLASYRHL